MTPGERFTAPVRRLPSLLVAAAVIAGGIGVVLAWLLGAEPGSRYNPGLAAMIAGPVSLGFAAWVAWPALRSPWFLRLVGTELDVLGRRTVDVTEIVLADLTDGQLVLELTPGAHGFPRSIRAPMRLSSESGPAILDRLREAGVRTPPPLSGPRSRSLRSRGRRRRAGARR
jgi:hypothetical protein